MAERAGPGGLKIWMHTIGYPPERTGGTEVHVRDLARGLVERGHRVCVSWCDAGGAAEVRREEREGVELCRVSSDHSLAYECSDFAPDVIHFHPLHADSIVDMVEVCARHAPVVLTYHTPTVTCARGDLLVYGHRACDGQLIQRRCAACVLQQRGAPMWLTSLLAGCPASFLSAVSRLPMSRRATNMLRWPARVRAQRESFVRISEKVAFMITVCEWLTELVAANGVQSQKVRMVRYGRALVRPKFEKRTGKFVFGYLGRINSLKGVSLLLDAVEKLPADLDFSFEFLSPDFDSAGLNADARRCVGHIRTVADRDRRVVIKGEVSPDRVSEVIAGWDVVVVPSIWMETGPQVVTEAFSVGTPVIGSRRGGIEELVREGVTGYLFEAGDGVALGLLLERAARDPEDLRALRPGIRPASTIDQMVDKVFEVYQACW